MLRPQTAFEKYFRHPLEAAALALAWSILRVLPIDVASNALGWIARRIGPMMPISDRARSNIRLAFPEKSGAEVEQIVVGMWENLGRTAGEFPHLHRFEFGDDARVRIDGLEHLTPIREGGGPSLFFSAHLANWELAPLSATMTGVPVVSVYREANNPLVEKFYLRGRQSFKDSLIRKGAQGAREMIQALRANKAVAVLMDQKMNDGIAVPFFGVDAMTAPALATLAQKFKCPVIAARVIRLDGARFRVEVEPPIQIGDSGDKNADILAFLTDINATIERWIRERPDQWLWLHNRWPSR